MTATYGNNYVGTAAERLALSAPNGVFFYETNSGRCYERRNDKWVYVKTVSLSVIDALKTPDTLRLAGSATIPSATGNGVLLNTDDPQFGWRDITGDITPRALGGPAPSFTAYRGGNTLCYAYAANDVVDLMVFHMPHDYVPGTDLFIHVHWGHNGTAIAGTFTVTLKATWCKGFNQAGNIFGAEVTPVITEVVTNIAGHPRWGHFVTETPLTSDGGSSTTIDRNTLEVDGVFLISFVVTSIPTITGGVTNAPYIFTCDLHYQSTNIATKGKAPNFYT